MSQGERKASEEPDFPFRENSDAVQAHLGIAQSVIQRMAHNSASSKGWCVAITSAILVLVANTSNPRFAFIALIPISLFLSLDAYYLALEKGFRAAYNSFIQKLHVSGIAAEDLYAIEPAGSFGSHLSAALRSFAVWPFYLTLALMVTLVWRYVL